MAGCCWPWRISPSRQVPVQIPPPSPPSCRKKELLSQADFTQLDKRTSIIPGTLLEGSYAALANHLTKSCLNDIERVRAIFNWMTSFKRKDIRIDSDITVDVEKSPEHTPLHDLLSIQRKENNDAHLFSRLSRAAGLACVVISGVAKNGSYVVGERGLLNKRERRAQWNAVLLDGEWRLLDVLWASCALVKRRLAGWKLLDVLGEADAGENIEEEASGEQHYQKNEFFFLTDPDLFICTHLPDDADWQLLPQPLSIRQFEEFVYLRERFFEMGMLIKRDSQRYCVLETTKGKVTISFGIPETLSEKPEFRYILYKQGFADEKGNMTDNDGDGGDENNKKDSHQDAVANNDDKLTIIWKGCIFNRQTKEGISYVCHMPTKGRYLIDIFGRASDNDDHMDLICSYIIVCNSTGDRLPDAPDIPWGPGAELEEVCLTPESHQDAVIDTDEPIVTIRFSKTPGANMVFWHAIKHEELDVCELRPRATLRISDDGGVIVVLRLLEPGIYAYKLFADFRTAATTAADIPNVCNYLIQLSDTSSRPQSPFPQLRWGILGYGIHAQAFLFQVTGPGADGYFETSSTKIVLTFNMSRPQCELYYELSQGPMDLSKSTRLVSLNVRDRDISDSTTIIDATLPEGGEYALNVYALRLVDDCRLYHVHSMHIVSSAPVVVDEDPIAANCPIDEGSTTDQLVPLQPNADNVSIAETFYVRDEVDDEDSLKEEAAESKTSEDDDIGPSAHPTCIKETSEEMYTIDLPQSDHKLLFAAERKAAQHPTSYIEMTRTHGDSGGGVLGVRLPQDGDYVIEVFEFCHNNLLDNTQRTHITRSIDKSFRDQKREEERIRREQKRIKDWHDNISHQLEAATECWKRDRIERIITVFIDAEVPDGNNLLAKAKRRLVHIKVRDDLTGAMKYRSLQKLEQAVAFAKREGFCDTPGRHLFRAKRMIARLKHIEMLRQEVMQLGIKAMLELKGYTHPPAILSDVITATLLVLGEPQNQLEEWKYIARHLLPTAGKTIQERIEVCDVKQVKTSMAVRAKSLVGMYDQLAITDVSAVAVPFFRWTREVIAMIDEPTKKYKEGEVDDLQLPDSLQPEQQAQDGQQMDPQQFGSQRLNSQQSVRQQVHPQPPDPYMLSKGNSNPVPSEHLPLITLTEPTQDVKENVDGEANGGTHRQHYKTGGEKDDANMPHETEM